jgi:hypothetical protein
LLCLGFPARSAAGPQQWRRGGFAWAPPGGCSVPRFFPCVWFLRIDACHRFATNDPHGGAQHSRRVHTTRLKTVGTLVTNPRMTGGALGRCGTGFWGGCKPRYSRCPSGQLWD